jgi:uncharacterized protein YjeT (DUF2065 family)
MMSGGVFFQGKCIYVIGEMTKYKGGKMEIYLMIALGLMYLVSGGMLSPRGKKKLWTAAFGLSFLLTIVAVFLIKADADETLMRAGEVNWYYLLSVFGAISLVLGAIVLWMYRKEVFRLFFGEDDDSDDAV